MTNLTISFGITLAWALTSNGPTFITELYTASIDTANIVSEGMLVEVTVWSLGMLCQASTRIYVKFKVVSNNESPTQELFSNKSLILSFFTFILPTVGSKIGFPRIVFKTFFLVCKITLVPIQILSTHEKARAYFINNHPKVKMLICDQANPQPTSTGESIVQQEVEEVSNSTIEDQFQDLMIQRVQNYVPVPMPSKQSYVEIYAVVDVERASSNQKQVSKYQITNVIFQEALFHN